MSSVVARGRKQRDDYTQAVAFLTFRQGAGDGVRGIGLTIHTSISQPLDAHLSPAGLSRLRSQATAAQLLSTIPYRVAFDVAADLRPSGSRDSVIKFGALCIQLYSPSHGSQENNVN